MRSLPFATLPKNNTILCCLLMLRSLKTLRVCSYSFSGQFSQLTNICILVSGILIQQISIVPTGIFSGHHLRGYDTVTITDMKYPLFSEDSPNQQIDDSLQLFSFKRRYQVPFSTFNSSVFACGQISKKLGWQPKLKILLLLNV